MTNSLTHTPQKPVIQPRILKQLIAGTMLLFSIHAVQAQNTPTWPATGDVGIGTATPLAPLHVQSATATVQGRFYGNVRSTAGGGGVILGQYINGTATVNTHRLGVLGFSGVTTTGMATSSATIAAFAEGNFTATSLPGSLRFYTAAVNTAAVVERMRIMPTGFVGVGTTAPAVLFHVQGTGGTQMIMVNTNPGSPTSGAFLSGYMNATPTVAGHRLGGLTFGSRGGGTQQYNGVAVIGYAEAAWTAGVSHPSYMTFETNPGGSITRAERMRITAAGDVGIGTTDTKGYRLAVNGTAIFTKVTVKPYANWPDYVFADAYELPPLAEVAAYIQRHHHLPDMVAAKEVEAHGLDLGDNQASLLKKIEELTLYAIGQEQKINKQAQHAGEQDQKIAALLSAVEQLQQTVTASH